MTKVEDCVATVELNHLDIQLGFMQIIFEQTFAKKSEGYIRLMQALSDKPSDLTLCYRAVESDIEQIL